MPRPTSPSLDPQSLRPEPPPAAKPTDAERRATSLASMRIDYPTDLPITAHRDDLVQKLRDHSVVVVCGETGSGKSTQLPKLLIQAGCGRSGMIGHTQPRRLAARTIAQRLAEETGTPLGQAVGYTVRFGDQTSAGTIIKLMTDGILLAETSSDRDLRAYDAIIIDEAHERSLNIDFLLGYLKQLLDRRPDLKVVITSATIDAERFASHFSDDSVPIVQVAGRGYPVEMTYLPADEAASMIGCREDNLMVSQHVVAGLEALRGGGDTLVFLPTERDIREVSHHVAGYYKQAGLEKRIELLPLYARLPAAQQQAIFSPKSGGRRRIIFATNVAESSLTVPGIHCVIDSGTARISRYSPRTKLQRLPIEPVSRASADQRAGRCGRVGPGRCVRLFSEEDYLARDRYTTPEIRRTNLAAVMLRAEVLNLGPFTSFPLLDPPRPEAVSEGRRTLAELGAIDEFHRLTPIGHRLGRLPVDPRVGRILIAAADNGVLPEVLPIAAAMEAQDPRDRPPDKRQQADEKQRPFVDGDSDFLGELRLWRFYEAARSAHGRGKLTRVLRDRFLSPSRMREWSDVYRQLRDLAGDIFLAEGRKPSGAAEILAEGRKPSGEAPGGLRRSARNEAPGGLRHSARNEEPGGLRPSARNQEPGGLRRSAGNEAPGGLRRSARNEAPGGLRRSAKIERRPNNKGRRGGLGPIRYHENATGDAADPDDRPEHILDPDRSELVHQSLLAGLLSGVAMLSDAPKKERTGPYTAAGGLQVAIWPGSGLSGTTPRWIVAAELVETGRQYARRVAKIQPQWIEAVGSHLLKTTHFDPHWSEKTGSAACYRRLTLYGLPVVARRRVALPPIDPETSRNLLIEHGLVGESLQTTAALVRHNREVVEAIARIGAKTRRRELIVDDVTLSHYYHSRLPAAVVDRKSLEQFDQSLVIPDWAASVRTDAGVLQWLGNPKIVPASDPPTPYAHPGDLVDLPELAVPEESFPDFWIAGETQLPLTYRFAPGEEIDGVLLTLPAAAIGQVSDEALEWLVPGLMVEKITLMIKSLPKRLRRNLVPAADVAARTAAAIEPMRGQAPFMPTLCKALTVEAGVRIDAAEFQEEKLPPHLRFLIDVVDDSGRSIARDRRVSRLADRPEILGTTGDVQPSGASDHRDQPWHRESMTHYDIESMPRQVSRRRGGVQIAEYPGFRKREDGVWATTTFIDAAEADDSIRAATTDLLAAATRKSLRAQVRHLPGRSEAEIRLGRLLSGGSLDETLQRLLSRIALVDGRPPIRSTEEFQSRVDDSVGAIAAASQELGGWLGGLAAAFQAARLARETRLGPASAAMRRDIDLQWAYLLEPGFFDFTPWPHLKHYPRYLRAIVMRVEKFQNAADRDTQNTRIVADLWNRWLATRRPDQREPRSVAADDPLRWMIEELRVSLFAQTLGTDGKISPTRCEKELARGERL